MLFKINCELFVFVCVFHMNNIVFKALNLVLLKRKRKTESRMSILSVILLTTVAAIVVYMPRTEAQYGGIFGGGSPGNSMMNGFNGLNSKIQFFLNGYKSLKQAKLKATTVRSTDAGSHIFLGAINSYIMFAPRSGRALV